MQQSSEHMDTQTRLFIHVRATIIAKIESVKRLGRIEVMQCARATA